MLCQSFLQRTANVDAVSRPVSSARNHGRVIQCVPHAVQRAAVHRRCGTVRRAITQRAAMFRPIAAGRLPSRVPQGDEPRRRAQITLPLPFRSISPAPIIASMPLRLLLKTLQCFFTKQVRVPLACFGELDDLVGDDLVSNRIVINFYPSISKRGANQLIRYSHNAHGLRIE